MKDKQTFPVEPSHRDKSITFKDSLNNNKDEKKTTKDFGLQCSICECKPENSYYRNKSVPSSNLDSVGHNSSHTKPKE